jgi:hypothetical protein
MLSAEVWTLGAAGLLQLDWQPPQEPQLPLEPLYEPQPPLESPQEPQPPQLEP